MSFDENEKISRSTNYPYKPEKGYSDLAETRIITKNLVYVIGLSSKLANKEILLKKEYFGQYGTITKIVVNKNKAKSLSTHVYDYDFLNALMNIFCKNHRSDPAN